MKKIKMMIVLLGLFFCYNLQAQTSTTLPTFNEESVVMKIVTVYFGTGYIFITDGVTSFELELAAEPLTLKKEKEKSCSPIVAGCINQLKKGGYKMIASSAGSFGTTGNITTNYFQKE